MTGAEPRAPARRRAGWLPGLIGATCLALTGCGAVGQAGQPQAGAAAAAASPSGAVHATDFDFDQQPLAPLILPLNPPPRPASRPGG